MDPNHNNQSEEDNEAYLSAGEQMGYVPPGSCEGGQVYIPSTIYPEDPWWSQESPERSCVPNLEAEMQQNTWMDFGLQGLEYNLEGDRGPAPFHWEIPAPVTPEVQKDKSHMDKEVSPGNKGAHQHHITNQERRLPVAPGAQGAQSPGYKEERKPPVAKRGKHRRRTKVQKPHTGEKRKEITTTEENLEKGKAKTPPPAQLVSGEASKEPPVKEDCIKYKKRRVLKEPEKAPIDQPGDGATGLTDKSQRSPTPETSTAPKQTEPVDPQVHPEKAPIDQPVDGATGLTDKSQRPRTPETSTVPRQDETVDLQIHPEETELTDRVAVGELLALMASEDSDILIDMELFREHARSLYSAKRDNLSRRERRQVEIIQNKKQQTLMSATIASQLHEAPTVAQRRLAAVGRVLWAVEQGEDADDPAITRISQQVRQTLLNNFLEGGRIILGAEYNQLVAMLNSSTQRIQHQLEHSFTEAGMDSYYGHLAALNCWCNHELTGSCGCPSCTESTKEKLNEICRVILQRMLAATTSNTWHSIEYEQNNTLENTIIRNFEVLVTRDEATDNLPEDLGSEGNFRGTFLLQSFEMEAAAAGVAEEDTQTNEQSPSAVAGAAAQPESTTESEQTNALCAICLEPLTLGPFQKRTEVTLKCGHRFHFTCLIQWMVSGMSGTCPICRAPCNSRYKGTINPIPASQDHNQVVTFGNGAVLATPRQAALSSGVIDVLSARRRFPGDTETIDSGIEGMGEVSAETLAPENRIITVNQSDDSELSEQGLEDLLNLRVESTLMTRGSTEHSPLSRRVENSLRERGSRQQGRTRPRTNPGSEDRGQTDVDESLSSPTRTTLLEVGRGNCRRRRNGGERQERYAHRGRQRRPVYTVTPRWQRTVKRINQGRDQRRRMRTFVPITNPNTRSTHNSVTREQLPRMQRQGRSPYPTRANPREKHACCRHSAASSRRRTRANSPEEIAYRTGILNGRVQGIDMARQALESHEQAANRQERVGRPNQGLANTTVTRNIAREAADEIELNPETPEDSRRTWNLEEDRPVRIRSTEVERSSTERSHNKTEGERLLSPTTLRAITATLMAIIWFIMIGAIRQTARISWLAWILALLGGATAAMMKEEGSGRRTELQPKVIYSQCQALSPLKECTVEVKTAAHFLEHAVQSEWPSAKWVQFKLSMQSEITGPREQENFRRQWDKVAPCLMKTLEKNCTTHPTVEIAMKKIDQAMKLASMVVLARTSCALQGVGRTCTEIVKAKDSCQRANSILMEDSKYRRSQGKHKGRKLGLGEMIIYGIIIILCSIATLDRLCKRMGSEKRERNSLFQVEEERPFYPHEEDCKICEQAASNQKRKWGEVESGYQTPRSNKPVTPSSPQKVMIWTALLLMIAMTGTGRAASITEIPGQGLDQPNKVRSYTTKDVTLYESYPRTASPALAIENTNLEVIFDLKGRIKRVQKFVRSLARSRKMPIEEAEKYCDSSLMTQLTDIAENNLRMPHYVIHSEAPKRALNTYSVTVRQGSNGSRECNYSFTWDRVFSLASQHDLSNSREAKYKDFTRWISRPAGERCIEKIDYNRGSITNEHTDDLFIARFADGGMYTCLEKCKAINSKIAYRRKQGQECQRGGPCTTVKTKPCTWISYNWQSAECRLSSSRDPSRDVEYYEGFNAISIKHDCMSRFQDVKASVIMNQRTFDVREACTYEPKLPRGQQVFHKCEGASKELETKLIPLRTKINKMILEIQSVHPQAKNTMKAGQEARTPELVDLTNKSPVGRKARSTAVTGRMINSAISTFRPKIITFLQEGAKRLLSSASLTFIGAPIPASLLLGVTSVISSIIMIVSEMIPHTSYEEVVVLEPHEQVNYTGWRILQHQDVLQLQAGQKTMMEEELLVTSNLPELLRTLYRQVNQLSLPLYRITHDPQPISKEISKTMKDHGQYGFYSYYDPESKTMVRNFVYLVQGGPESANRQIAIISQSHKNDIKQGTLVAGSSPAGTSGEVSWTCVNSVTEQDEIQKQLPRTCYRTPDHKPNKIFKTPFLPNADIWRITGKGQKVSFGCPLSGPGTIVTENLFIALVPRQCSIEVDSKPMRKGESAPISAWKKVHVLKNGHFQEDAERESSYPDTLKKIIKKIANSTNHPVWQDLKLEEGTAHQWFQIMDGLLATGAGSVAIAVAIILTIKIRSSRNARWVDATEEIRRLTRREGVHGRREDLKGINKVSSEGSEQ